MVRATQRTASAIMETAPATETVRSPPGSAGFRRCKARGRGPASLLLPQVFVLEAVDAVEHGLDVASTDGFVVHLRRRVLNEQEQAAVVERTRAQLADALGDGLDRLGQDLDRDWFLGILLHTD